MVRGDFGGAGVTPAEAAMMAYARKVTLRAHEVTAPDIQELRGHGFSDEEILDIAFAAAARTFFSKVLDAVGAEPDATYLAVDEPFRRAMAVGRPFEPTPVGAPVAKPEGIPD